MLVRVTRMRLVVVSLLLVTGLVVAGYLIWSSSSNRHPSGATLVWHYERESSTPPDEEVVQPFYHIQTRRVRV